MYYFAMMRQNNIFGVELSLWRHQMGIKHANIVQQSGRCTFALTFFNVLINMVMSFAFLKSVKYLSCFVISQTNSWVLFLNQFTDKQNCILNKFIHICICKMALNKKCLYSTIKSWKIESFLFTSILSFA